MKTVVAGIGNSFRGDDAFGPSVVEALRTHPLPSHVTALTLRGEMSEILDLFSNFDRVFIVDAAMSQSDEAGKIFILNPLREALPKTFSNSSTHSMGLREAVEVARELELLPRELALYLVNGVNFEIGCSTLSPLLQNRVPEVVNMILSALDGSDTIEAKVESKIIDMGEIKPYA